MKILDNEFKNRIYFEKFNTKDDFKYFLKLVFNEEVMALNYGRIFTLEEAEYLYNYALDTNSKYEDFGEYKVFDSATNTFIGTCGFLPNEDLSEAEIEYLLLPEYWGMRYGSEIAGMLLKKSEKIKSIQKVIANLDPKNMGSKKILLNSGFVSCKLYENPDNGSPVEMFIKEIVHD